MSVRMPLLAKNSGSSTSAAAEQDSRSHKRRFWLA
jgi:hypothetical protein